MSDEMGPVGAAVVLIVYVVSVIITGSLWGPVALIIDWLCTDLGSSLAICE
jgi:hypothetical protein